MWGSIITAIAGAVIGGVVNGVTTYQTTGTKVKAYKQAAKQVSDSAEKYSGEQLYNRMVSEGQTNAALRNEQRKAQDLMGNVDSHSQNQNSMVTLNQNDDYTDVTGPAFNEEANREAALSRAMYNKDTTQANQLMKQADIDYNVANSAVQAATGAVGGGLSTMSQIGNKWKGNL